MRRLALTAVCLALVAPAAVAKGQPQPISFDATSSHDFRMGTLDTQGCYPHPDTSCWVNNPTPCVWNDQDDVLRASRGYVEGTWTDGLCLIADYDGTFGPAGPLYPHGIYVNVSAPGDTLAVSLANDAGDSWTAGPSVPSGNNRRLWRLCVSDPVAAQVVSSIDEWPEVPDSNGGRGQRVQYTLTVTSPDRRTRDVVARFEIATRYHNPPVPGERHSITNCP